MTETANESGNRTVVGNISLSLDGRVVGPGGEYDMSWIVPHAVTGGSRAHMVEVTTTATTALLGRKNYQGFGSFWPAVADDEQADLRDRAFAQWLNAVEKVVFSTALQQADWHNSRIAAADPAATVRQLRKEQGGDIVVLPSASIIRNLLEAGELHRLSITLCPELVGGGACLFDDGPAGSSWSLTSMTGTESASDLPALRPDPASVTMPCKPGRQLDSASRIGRPAHGRQIQGDHVQTSGQYPVIRVTGDRLRVRT